MVTGIYHSSSHCPHAQCNHSNNDIAILFLPLIYVRMCYDAVDVEPMPMKLLLFFFHQILLYLLLISLAQAYLMETMLALVGMKYVAPLCPYLFCNLLQLLNQASTFYFQKYKYKTLILSYP